MSARIRSRNGIALLIALGGAITIVPAISGQEQPADVKADVADVNDKDHVDKSESVTPTTDDDADSILAMILSSGTTGVAFMAVLGLFSVVAGTVAVERAVNMRRNRIVPADFVEDLQRLTRRQDAPLESFSELCSTTTAPIATILQAGLLRLGRPLLEIEKSIEDAAAREMAELRAKIRPLSTVGSIAPLVGLLGTVVGMIIAFHTASQAGLGKAELLAKGIYMALLTTAGGLSVAIPSLLLAAFFSGRVERFFREMDAHLMQVLPCLARSEQTAGSDHRESIEARRSDRNPLMSVKV